MQRHYVTVGRRQVHYRRGGKGPPLVMLHPSPQSSRAVLPMAQAFAEHFSVIALDAPGYGLSDPPDFPVKSLQDYLDPLRDTLDALGLARCALYGAATGAQFAIEFSKRYPERVAVLMMDTNGHVSDAECEEILAGYMPDVTPRRDGAHLLTTWDMVRHLTVFFPWQSTRADQRLAVPLPDAAAIQAAMNDYLRAGADYHVAYRAAFYTERAENALGLKIPATMMRWEGSIALPWTDAMLAYDLPKNIRILHAGKPFGERQRVQVEALREMYAGAAEAPPPAPAAIPGALANRFVTLPGGQIRVRMSGEGSGRPLVVLAAAGASSVVLEPAMKPLLGKRPVIAIDYPGHGESDDTLGGAPLTVASLAETVAQVLQALGISMAEILGHELGGCVALALAAKAASLVERVTLIEPPLPGLDAARITPDIAPRPDGRHLVTAWSYARDERLFAPWYDTGVGAIIRRNVDLDPASLNTRTVELLKCGHDRLARAHAAMLAQPLGRIAQPATVAVTEAHPQAEAWKAEAARLGARFVTVPTALHGWSAALLGAED
jgi:pimeloyl-ACP methyl ester carboxylesterase